MRCSDSCRPNARTATTKSKTNKRKEKKTAIFNRAVSLSVNYGLHTKLCLYKSYFVGFATAELLAGYLVVTSNIKMYPFICEGNSRKSALVAFGILCVAK